jgi:hypothetical protein
MVMSAYLLLSLELKMRGIILLFPPIYLQEIYRCFALTPNTFTVLKGGMDTQTAKK